MYQYPYYPQANCCFVRSPAELNNMNIMPFTTYVGLNSEKDEIYVRKMNNDGLIDLKTYILQSAKEEKSEIQKIYDKLDERLNNIEQKLAQRPILTMGKKDERNTKHSNE